MDGCDIQNICDRCCEGPVFEACKGNDLDRLKALLDADESLTDALLPLKNSEDDDPPRLRPMHVCAEFGSLECMKELVARGASVALHGGDKVVPAWCAADNGHSECFKYMMSIAGSHSALCSHVPYLWPVEYALRCSKPGGTEIVRYLFEKEPEEMRARVGQQHVNIAAGAWNLETLQYLVEEAGYRADDECVEWEYTPLFSATQDPLGSLAEPLSSALPVVEYLVKKCGCSPLAEQPETSEPFGSTPYHAAITSGLIDVVKFFMEECGCEVTSREVRMAKQSAQYHREHFSLKDPANPRDAGPSEQSQLSWIEGLEAMGEYLKEKLPGGPGDEEEDGPNESNPVPIEEVQGSGVVLCQAECINRLVEVCLNAHESANTDGCPGPNCEGPCKIVHWQVNYFNRLAKESVQIDGEGGPRVVFRRAEGPRVAFRRSCGHEYTIPLSANHDAVRYKRLIVRYNCYTRESYTSMEVSEATLRMLHAHYQMNATLRMHHPQLNYEMNDDYTRYAEYCGFMGLKPVSKDIYDYHGELFRLSNPNPNPAHMGFFNAANVAHKYTG